MPDLNHAMFVDSLGPLIPMDAGECALESYLDDLDRQGKYWTHAYSPGGDIEKLKFFLGPKPAHWTGDFLARELKRERYQLPGVISRCERWLTLDHNTCYNPARAKEQAAEIAVLLPAVKALL